MGFYRTVITACLIIRACSKLPGGFKEGDVVYTQITGDVVPVGTKGTVVGAYDANPEQLDVAFNGNMAHHNNYDGTWNVLPDNIGYKIPLIAVATSLLEIHNLLREFPITFTEKLHDSVKQLQDSCETTKVHDVIGLIHLLLNRNEEFYFERDDGVMVARKLYPKEWFMQQLKVGEKQAKVTRSKKEYKIASDTLRHFRNLLLLILQEHDFVFHDIERLQDYLGAKAEEERVDEKAIRSLRKRSKATKITRSETSSFAVWSPTWAHDASKRQAPKPKRLSVFGRLSEFFGFDHASKNIKMKTMSAADKQKYAEELTFGR